MSHHQYSQQDADSNKNKPAVTDKTNAETIILIMLIFIDPLF